MEKHGKELERARTLVKKNQYEEALKAYMNVFEQGRDTSPFVGARLSYVLSETAELGKIYEPARTMLEKYREAHEQLMLLGKFSVFAIQEWAALCKYTDNDRKIEYYDLLKDEASKNKELLANIRQMIWLELVSKHRYEEFSPSELATKLKETALISAQHLSPNSALNMMPNIPEDSKMKDFAIELLLRHCGAIYECASGLNKQSLAKKAFKLATFHYKSGIAYACFITAANRAGNAEQAKKLVKEAKWCLPESEMRPVLAAEKTFNL